LGATLEIPEVRNMQIKALTARKTRGFPYVGVCLHLK